MVSNRYVFADLNALEQVARSYIQDHPNEFAVDPENPVDAQKLTSCFRKQVGEVEVFRGCYSNFESNEIQEFQVAGWLDALLEANFDKQPFTYNETLVLLTGKLTDGVLNQTKRYNDTGYWQVQIYNLCGEDVERFDHLLSESLIGIESRYVGDSMRKLLKYDHPGRARAQSRREARTGSSDATERYVFMDLDGITETLFYSAELYKYVPGARSARDVRINFEALSRLVCGNDKTKVRRQVAIFDKTSPTLVPMLYKHGWTVGKQQPGSILMTAQKEVVAELANSPIRKTLVLVTNLRALEATSSVSFLKLLITKRWRIEIYAWRGDSSNILMNLAQVQIKWLDDELDKLVFLKAQPTDTDKSSTLTANFLESACARRLKVVDTTTGDVELARMQQQLQQLQSAFIEVQADSATQRSRQQEYFETQLQQQKEVLERLSAQRI